MSTSQSQKQDVWDSLWVSSWWPLLGRFCVVNRFALMYKYNFINIINIIAGYGKRVFSMVFASSIVLHVAAMIIMIRLRKECHLLGKAKEPTTGHWIPLVQNWSTGPLDLDGLRTAEGQSFFGSSCFNLLFTKKNVAEQWQNMGRADAARRWNETALVTRFRPSFKDSQSRACDILQLFSRCFNEYKVLWRILTLNRIMAFLRWFSDRKDAIMGAIGDDQRVCHRNGFESMAQWLNVIEITSWTRCWVPKKSTSWVQFSAESLAQPKKGGIAAQRRYGSPKIGSPYPSYPLPKNEVLLNSIVAYQGHRTYGHEMTWNDMKSYLLEVPSTQRTQRPCQMWAARLLSSSNWAILRINLSWFILSSRVIVDVLNDLNEFHSHLCQLKNRMWRRSPTRVQSGWLRLQLAQLGSLKISILKQSIFWSCQGFRETAWFFHEMEASWHIPFWGTNSSKRPAIQGNEELAKYAETHHDAHAATEAVAVLARFWLILVDISCSPFIPFEVANGCWMQQMPGICWIMLGQTGRKASQEPKFQPWWTGLQDTSRRSSAGRHPVTSSAQCWSKVFQIVPIVHGRETIRNSRHSHAPIVSRMYWSESINRLPVWGFDHVSLSVFDRNTSESETSETPICCLCFIYLIGGFTMVSHIVSYCYV